MEIKNKEILQQKEEIESQSEELKTINDKLAEKNEELNQQNEEIASQRDRLSEQNELIAQINTDLTDSIQYARSIQEAMLPNIDRIKSFIPNFFIYFKPRDIVSGDFYWFYKHEDQLILVAADCTGHGVPGAFMSMLGNDLLHDIVIGKQVTDPAQILSELNKGIKRALKQNTSSNRDGMDMAICLIDRNEEMITFAGAKNPLFYVENGEPKLIKGTNNPVGGEFRTDADPYVNHQIPIQENTVFYLYSDGYQDQFGGAKGKKFMSNNFRKLLFEMHHLPMDKQENILDLRFNEWKGNHARLDDVLVMGFHL
jgi:serine phosphatase RsbU (regulator of sigma subunit)